jgi:translation initiation factor IF-2
VNKYRVHEVAKDFALPSKEVASILTEHLTPPKNHMQALTDEELNLVFDHVTLNNQIESIEVIFAKTYKEPPRPEKAPEPAPEAKPDFSNAASLKATGT